MCKQKESTGFVSVKTLSSCKRTVNTIKTPEIFGWPYVFGQITIYMRSHESHRGTSAQVAVDLCRFPEAADATCLSGNL